MTSPIELMYEFVTEMDFANLPAHLKQKYFDQLLSMQNSAMRMMYNKAYLEGQRGDACDPEGAVEFFYAGQGKTPEQTDVLEVEHESPVVDKLEVEVASAIVDKLQVEVASPKKEGSNITDERCSKWVSEYYSKRIADIIVKCLNKKELQKKVLTFISKNSSPYGDGYSDYITRHKIISNFKSEKGVDKDLIAELKDKRFIRQLHFKIKITHLGMAELEKK